MQAQEQRYGVGANSYRAAGELAGLTRLVDDFYSNMDSFPEARVIRDMHPKDIDEIRRKLTYFLCGWLGGPRLFAEHYGGISIPGFHQPLPIGESDSAARSEERRLGKGCGCTCRSRWCPSLYNNKY